MTYRKVSVKLLIYFISVAVATFFFSGNNKALAQACSTLNQCGGSCAPNKMCSPCLCDTGIWVDEEKCIDRTTGIECPGATPDNPSGGGGVCRDPQNASDCGNVGPECTPIGGGCTSSSICCNNGSCNVPTGKCIAAGPSCSPANKCAVGGLCSSPADCISNICGEPAPGTPKRCLDADVPINNPPVATPPSWIGPFAYAGPLFTFTSLLGAIAGLLIPIGLAIGAARTAIAGWGIMFSEGNPQKVAAAQEELFSSITGSVFILLSTIIFRVILNSFLGNVSF